eukprot:TRINITY_DN17055_c0_g4_i2.p1 TRINITY_DN17055_c0_g4~~TRINITY_DN17055_c0_g4_i2.p1  ORF type:complete len:402 (-),score=36.55 TRINITY_DN17055_c0_g4_i2:64-1269(-)
MFSDISLKIQKWWPIVKKWFVKNSLPVFVLIGIIIGLIFPLPGDFVYSFMVGDYHVVQTINVCVIFFVSGFTLRSSEIKEAFSIYFIIVYLYSSIVILFVTPLLGIAVLNVPYVQQGFIVGLVVMCTAPTTITSGATMVQAANGNYVLALVVTVSTNAIGVFTVPFILKLILQKFNYYIYINALQLLINLLLTVLLPLLVAFLLQNLHHKISNFSRKNKVFLGVFSNANLGVDIWQIISSSQKSIIQSKISIILLFLFFGFLMHLIYFGFNFFVVKIVGKWGEKEKRAVLILASQKSLAISVTLISYFGDEVGSKGIISLPCILAYIVQIIVDSIIVAKWSAQDEKLLNDKQYNIQQQYVNIYNNDSNNSSDNKSGGATKQDLEEQLLSTQENHYDSNTKI